MEIPPEFANAHKPENSSVTGRVLETNWTGIPVILAFYDQPYSETYSDGSTEVYHRIIATLFVGDEHYRYTRKELYSIGPEGGDPIMEDRFFANVDDDPETELLVIISWNQKHYDLKGVLYATYIFDDRKSPEGPYAYLETLSRHFDGCDCAYRDGTVKEAEFKTAAEVKAELERLLSGN